MVFHKDALLTIDKRLEERYPQIEQLLKKMGAYADKSLAAMSLDAKDVILRYYLAYMPLEDLVSYDFEVFESYASHAALLFGQHYSSSDYSGVVQPRSENWAEHHSMLSLSDTWYFLRYVAMYRSNNECIQPCVRPTIYKELSARIAGLSPFEMVKELNYWCAEYVSYEPGDMRTASAHCTWTSGRGRCGEESVFAIDAFRSVGIMARQVYVPMWTHCDDNHAWVEVYLDGAWHYLGACEPEAVLDKGWFSRAARRAPIVRTMLWGEVLDDEEIVGSNGCAYYVNASETYIAELRAIKSDVKTSVAILNGSELHSIAEIDPQGLGNSEVHIQKDLEVFLIQDAKAADSYSFALEGIQHAFSEPAGSPAPLIYGDSELDESERIEAAKTKRQEYRAQVEERYREKLLRFREGAAEHLESRGLDKAVQEELIEEALAALAHKDQRDFNPSQLAAHLGYVAQYFDSFTANAEDRTAFLEGLLPMRIGIEELSLYVAALPEAERSSLLPQVTAKPELIYKEVDERIEKTKKLFKTGLFAKRKARSALDALHMPSLIIPLASVLARSYVLERNRNYAIVALARALGIPAKLRAEDGEPLLYYAGAWHSEGSPQKNQQLVKVALSYDADLAPSYGVDFSLSPLPKDVHDSNTLVLGNSLSLSGDLWQQPITLKQGSYQLICSTRLSNGSLVWKRDVVELRATEDEVCQLMISTPKVAAAEMTIAEPMKHRSFSTLEGASCSLDTLFVEGLEAVGSESRSKILLWLSPDHEPSDHAVREILEAMPKEERARNLIVIYRDAEAAKLAQLTEPHAQLGARVLIDSEGKNRDLCARDVFVEPGCDPLLLVVEGTHEDMRIRYAHSAYGVGVVALAYKIYRI